MIKFELLLSDIYSVIVDRDGDIIWFANFKIHREGGPAIEKITKSELWFKSGFLHREDGPAYTNVERNIISWYFDGCYLSKEEWESKIRCK